MKIDAPRITLESITPSLAQRIVKREERVGDAWHPEYPLVDELDPLRALAASADPDPDFTMYLIRRSSDCLAVGGFGFFDPPDADGRVEFGYGLIPDARGMGFATEAVRAGLGFAAVKGAHRAVADTAVDNIPSQRVLTKSGLVESSRDAALVYFECNLSDPMR